MKTKVLLVFLLIASVERLYGQELGGFSAKLGLSITSFPRNSERRTSINQTTPLHGPLIGVNYDLPLGVKKRFIFHSGLQFQTSGQKWYNAYVSNGNVVQSEHQSWDTWKISKVSGPIALSYSILKYKKFTSSLYLGWKPTIIVQGYRKVEVKIVDQRGSKSTVFEQSETVNLMHPEPNFSFSRLTRQVFWGIELDVGKRITCTTMICSGPSLKLKSLSHPDSFHSLTNIDFEFGLIYHFKNESS